MICSLSKLTEKDLQEINNLEQEIHSPLLAFSCSDTPMTELSSENLQKIQSLEKKLGVSLVAVAGKC
ncbi:hypothetical protein A7E78_08310 [Syntrophotalea acetylenivorans]|uniref:Uncharacterized protein n=1 Tax=Syntrophotalea acetylenivorans TaxID=1842532 RepID=A0A1L3GPH5_9BACT|nr:hypothetical protein [Syntrophotalea acetylenivorans]APG27837.1 hypothetical protein A7E78_08310 [Syntrophotalea acetylenivorans]